MGAVGAVRAVGVRVVVSGSVVSPCIIPETLALSETLVLLRAVVVLLWLQKVVPKPEIPLQSAETTAFRGTSGGRLARLVASETRYLPETRCFLGTWGGFGGGVALGELASRSSSLLTRPFEISSLSAFSPFLGTRSLFRAWRNLNPPFLNIRLHIPLGLGCGRGKGA